MTHGSLYSGIGGWLLAAEWAGIENIFTCEIEDFPNKVLDKHFPDTDRHYDIKETDFTKYRGAIDIISTSDPCQPFSVAGQQKGETDDRYLWIQTVRSIREIKPAFVVFENVPGLSYLDNGRLLERIFFDLEGEGYKCEAFIIPAFAVSAIHRRDRLWVIGYIADSGSMGCNWNRNIKRIISTGREAFAESYSCIQAIRNNKIPEFNRKHNGVSSELDQDRIKALGNSIVPQIAYIIFEAIKQVIDLQTKIP